MNERKPLYPILTDEEMKKIEEEVKKNHPKDWEEWKKWEMEHVTLPNLRMAKIDLAIRENLKKRN